jgi:hypothetical protein
VVSAEPVGSEAGRAVDLAGVASAERGLGVVWTQEGSEDLNATSRSYVSWASALCLRFCSHPRREPSSACCISSGWARTGSPSHDSSV